MHRTVVLARPVAGVLSVPEVVRVEQAEERDIRADGHRAV